MQIITIAVIKGGNGKSTTTAALAQAAAASGYKVLAIDLEPQANLTEFLAADPGRPGTYQLLHGADPEELIQTTEQGIDVIPASLDLATEKTATGSATRLQNAIKPIKKRYDYIFIDTPPAAGELIFNALQASTGLIIPLETDKSNIDGFYEITDIANQIRRNSNPKLSFIGTVITRYERTSKINKYMRDMIEEKAAELNAPLLMEIRKATAIREAQLFQQSIYEYAPKSNPAQDYMQLFEMIDKKK